MQDLFGKSCIDLRWDYGIGLAAAKAFVASGAKVVVAARNPERAFKRSRSSDILAATQPSTGVM